MELLTLLLIIGVILLIAWCLKTNKIEGLDSLNTQPMHLVAPGLPSMGLSMPNMKLGGGSNGDMKPDACDYLLNEIQDGDYAAQVSQVCQSYKAKCGESSLANEVVYLSENTEIDWPDKSQDLLNNFQIDLNKDCAPKMPCSQDDPCPSFLTCANGTCG